MSTLRACSAMLIALFCMNVYAGVTEIKESKKIDVVVSDKQNLGKSSNVRIAVIDVQLIMENSTSVQSIRDAIDKIYDKTRHELSEKESNLKKEEEELMSMRGKVSEQDFEEKMLIFNSKVTDVQREVQEQKVKIDKAHTDAMSKVHEVTIQIISDLATEKSFNIALPASQILFFHKDLDITNDVLERLNSRLPDISVKF